MKTILFVCVHNAGRSQMAEALFNHHAAERGLDARAQSAGTRGGGEINPVAQSAIEELGVSMAGHYPKQLTSEMAKAADRTISMGCGVDADDCPALGREMEDWGLDDPKGQPIETVRAIRDQIQTKVLALIDELK